MKNCNECKWVSLTEEQQKYNRIDHVCLKYETRVYHRSTCTSIFHSFIYPCKQCDGKEFEQR